MASQNLNVGTSANSNDGDTLRAAFIKLKQMFAEVYGQTYSEQGDLSGTDFKIKANKLQMTADAVAGDDGKVLTYDHASGSFTWEDAFTGTIGDITGIVAGDGLTGSSLDENEATLNVVGGTGITVAADSVSLATSVQSEISANTAKTGITATQAGHITANNAKDTFPGFGTAAGTSLEGDTALLQVGTLATEALAGNTTTITTAQANEITANTLKVSDQTVVLTEGANVTITGTYPSFTIASDDVVGAVNSVNGDAGVVVLDTADIAENTNLYYTEARVTANAEVTANTAKTGITAQQASDITDNNAKLTDQTVTLTDGGNVTITGTYPNFTLSSPDVTGAVTSVNGAVGVVVLDTADISEDTNLYYTEARVSANTDVAANTAKTGITTQQISDITDNNAKLTNATHDGEVTGSGTLTITDGAVVADRLATDAVTTVKMANDSVTHDKLATRFTHQTEVSTLENTVNYDCSEASSFKLTGDITGAYTINLTNYKLNQIITIFPLKGDFGVYLTAGTGTGVFNKLSEVDYDGTVNNILQIECVDDQATTPVFFYSVATFAAGATI